METFTELRPEALEWLSPAKRSRQLRGWGLQGGAQWARHRKHLSGATLVLCAPALDSVHGSTVPF